MLGPALITAGLVDMRRARVAPRALFVGTGVVGQIVGRRALEHPVIVARMAAD